MLICILWCLLQAGCSWWSSSTTWQVQVGSYLSICTSVFLCLHTYSCLGMGISATFGSVVMQGWSASSRYDWWGITLLGCWWWYWAVWWVVLESLTEEELQVQFILAFGELWVAEDDWGKAGAAFEDVSKFKSFFLKLLVTVWTSYG